jgi:hypothetical protein
MPGCEPVLYLPLIDAHFAGASLWAALKSTSVVCPLGLRKGPPKAPSSVSQAIQDSQINLLKTRTIPFPIPGLQEATFEGEQERGEKRRTREFERNSLGVF